MSGFLATKIPLMIAGLVITVSAGVGISVLSDEVSISWEGTNELAEVEAIVVQLVSDITELDTEIALLNDEIALNEADALALQGQIDALTIEKGELEVELQEANNELEQFQIDICAVIDTLPPSQRIKYNEWCGVFGEGIPDPQGDYLEGIYTATVDATNYTSYSDEDYTTVTITVDANGWITDVVFDVFTNGALSKYDASYATWLNWDTQADTVVATIISDQNADNLDAIASVSISISGFELAFNTAIVDAIPDPVDTYLEGTYTATVYATNYTSYSDEDYTTVTITVDATGTITDVVFDVFTDGALSKYDVSYAPFLNWDTQADTVVATILSDQNADNLDAIASVSISISGFELAFNTAIADAIATP